MIVFNDRYDEGQLNIISAISKIFGISFGVAKIMFSRGIDSISKAKTFLNPGMQNFNDPYKLKGMREAVDRIKQAKENGESVLVFGDYDADGICASTVLTKSLKDFGITTLNNVIPERSQGYGLTHKLVESMLERYNPDLIITVDCGISCKEEIAFIEDIGVDVIVTDHHEIPPEIPDCTVINCRIKGQDYPFDSLCGAGVAYKLSYALIGDRANKYLDFVAVATIADSMPLIGENRDIVSEGLKIINKSPNFAIRKLLDVSGAKEINSGSLAYAIAPRINAAGRMGDARAALDMFLESDEDKIVKDCFKLNQYNVARQAECDELFKSAEAKILQVGLDDNVIVLADDSWNGGLVGIVAAKLVEKYSRPVILFTKNDEFYHGSARSIENINIFEAISSCRDLFVDYGGHAQAAGITIKGENLPELSRRLSKFIAENYDKATFDVRIEVEDMVEGRFTMEFAEELDALEPFGVGNKKPLFCIKAENVLATPTKSDSQHLNIKTDYIDLMYFGGKSNLGILNSPAEKYIVFEPNISVFNGRRFLKGFVRYLEYKVVNSKRLYLDCFKRYLLSVFNDGTEAEMCDNRHIGELIEKYRDDSATVFAVYDINTLHKLNIGKMNCSLYAPKSGGRVSELVFALSDCKVSNVDRVIYLDKPLKNATISCADEYFTSDIEAFCDISLSTSRAVFGEVFKLLKDNRFYGNDSADIALAVFGKNAFSNYSSEQIIFCLEVFCELKIFFFDKGTLQFDGRVKSDLNNSKIYSAISAKLNKSI